MGFRGFGPVARRTHLHPPGPLSPTSLPCDDTCHDLREDVEDAEDDHVVMVLTQLEDRYEAPDPSHYEAPARDPTVSAPRSSRDPERSSQEPWYMACHSFPSSPLLRPLRYMLSTCSSNRPPLQRPTY